MWAEAEGVAFAQLAVELFKQLRDEYQAGAGSETASAGRRQHYIHAVHVLEACLTPSHAFSHLLTPSHIRAVHVLEECLPDWPSEAELCDLSRLHGIDELRAPSHTFSHLLSPSLTFS